MSLSDLPRQHPLSRNIFLSLSKQEGRPSNEDDADEGRERCEEFAFGEGFSEEEMGEETCEGWSEKREGRGVR